ncbi:MAG: L,D-transpeptidase family protein [Thermomicrobiales bacterium]
MPDHIRRPSISRRSLVRGTTALALGGALGRVLSPMATPVAAQVPPASRNVYFPKTGHNLREPFLSRWEDSGGEAVWGAPISEERFQEGDGVVQTFEAITLVFDPAFEFPWDVQALQLPKDFRDEQTTRAAATRRAGCTTPDCDFVAQTGHSISGDMLTYWNTHGAAPMLGLPTSEPFPDRESGATVQVFERAVLEDTGNGVIRPRPLGRILAERDGLLTSAAFAPAPPSGGETSLVVASDGLRLRGEPTLDSPILVVLPDNAEFIAVPDSTGDWVPGYVDGYAGWVSRQFLREPDPLPQRDLANWDPTVWQGAALSETNVRARPTTSAPTVDELFYGDSLTVTAWVKGEEIFEGADLWAQVGDKKYIYSRNVGRNAPVLPPPVPLDAPTIGRWIDVNLTQQLMVAYEGQTPARTSVTTTGMAGWETPPGFYAIQWRVPNETMTSGAIGAEHFFKLEDVLFTQYFTDRGHAIHFAWWRTPETIGRPGSHGCLNLLLEDARFFWDWADIGTPVYVHY